MGEVSCCSLMDTIAAEGAATWPWCNLSRIQHPSETSETSKPRVQLCLQDGTNTPDEFSESVGMNCLHPVTPLWRMATEWSDICSAALQISSSWVLCSPPELSASCWEFRCSGGRTVSQACSHVRFLLPLYFLLLHSIDPFQWSAKVMKPTMHHSLYFISIVNFSNLVRASFNYGKGDTFVPYIVSLDFCHAAFWKKHKDFTSQPERILDKLRRVCHCWRNTIKILSEKRSTQQPSHQLRILIDWSEHLRQKQLDWAMESGQHLKEMLVFKLVILFIYLILVFFIKQCLHLLLEIECWHEQQEPELGMWLSSHPKMTLV